MKYYLTTLNPFDFCYCNPLTVLFVWASTMAPTPFHFPTYLSVNGQVDAFVPMYPAFITPCEAYAEAKQLNEDKNSDQSSDDQLNWAIYLQAFSIFISESRVFSTFSNFLTIVMAVGVNVRRSHGWVVISFVAYIPRAISTAMKVFRSTSLNVLPFAR